MTQLKLDVTVNENGRRSRFHATVALAAVLLALLAGSCGEHPTAPAGGNTGPSGPAATVTRLELIAPSSIAPGESIQLRARAIKSDNSGDDVTAATRWSSGPCCALDVSTTGRATGRSLGESRIWASYGSPSVQASTTIFVLPPSTFRLSGIVTDSGLALQNATAAVILGTGAGATTVTDASGAYRLYGVAGHVRVQVKKDGYQDWIQDLEVSDHRVLNLEMAANRRSDLRGVYSLRIESAGCARTWGNPFPDEALRRSYTATVAQDGGGLTVTLSADSLVPINGGVSQFTGLLEPNDAITFWIRWSDYYYSDPIGSNDLVERLSDGTAVIIGGKVSGGRTASGISGTLAAVFNISTRTTPPFTWPFSSQCSAPTTAFDMVRR